MSFAFKWTLLVHLGEYKVLALPQIKIIKFQKYNLVFVIFLTFLFNAYILFE